MSQLIQKLDSRHQSYLRDESKVTGFAESISFPESIAAIQRILRECQQKQEPLTIQGGRTGVMGGAVPLGGHVLNLTAYTGEAVLSQVDKSEALLLTVKSGTTLQDIESLLGDGAFYKANGIKGGNYFFPVESTEKTATIGGLIATGAKGPTAAIYGDITDYLQEVTSVTMAGELQTQRLSGHDRLEGEGTEIIVEAKISIIKEPASRWSIIFFFTEEKVALMAAETIKQATHEQQLLAAFEYLDDQSLGLIEEGRQAVETLPPLADKVVAALYLELHGEEEAVMETAEEVIVLLSDLGGDADLSWVATERLEIARLHDFYHTLQEQINQRIELRRQSMATLDTYQLTLGFPNKKLMAAVAEVKRLCQSLGLPYAIQAHVLLDQLRLVLLPEKELETEAYVALFNDCLSHLKKLGAVNYYEFGSGKINQSVNAIFG